MIWGTHDSYIGSISGPPLWFATGPNILSKVTWTSLTPTSLWCPQPLNLVMKYTHPTCNKTLCNMPQFTALIDKDSCYLLCTMMRIRTWIVSTQLLCMEKNYYQSNSPSNGSVWTSKTPSILGDDRTRFFLILGYNCKSDISWSLLAMISHVVLLSIVAD